MITQRHTWKGSTQCRRCGTTKSPVCWVGVRILWTYVQPNGTRHTGQAPECMSVPGAVATDQRPEPPSPGPRTPRLPVPPQLEVPDK